MKCPCCGHEMVMDDHRKIDMFMCYDCGFIEGRNLEQKPHSTNYERLRNMNLNESIACLCNTFGLEEKRIASWLETQGLYA